MTARVDVRTHYTVDSNGCWNWRGGIDVYGYGLMSGNRKAHREAYRVARGEIPEGLCVCHTCDNRRCVNPNHLFLGTHADNSDDKLKKGRQANGESIKKGGLNEAAVVEILQSREPCFVLAKRFGVSDTAVSYVRLGKTWKHVPRPPGYTYKPYRAPGNHTRYLDEATA